MTVHGCKRTEEGVGNEVEIQVRICIPTSPTGEDRWQGRARLREQLEAAHTLLIEKGMASLSAWQLLEPATDLLGDIAFWKRQSEGLAVLLSGGGLQLLHLPVKPRESATIDIQSPLPNAAN